MRVKLLNIYTGMNWIFLFCFYFTPVLHCLKSKQIEHYVTLQITDKAKGAIFVNFIQKFKKN